MCCCTDSHDACTERLQNLAHTASLSSGLERQTADSLSGGQALQQLGRWPSGSQLCEEGHGLITCLGMLGVAGTVGAATEAHSTFVGSVGAA